MEKQLKQAREFAGKAMKNNAVRTTAIYVGGGLLAYYFVVKPMLRKVGFIKSKEAEAQAKALTEFAQSTQKTQALSYAPYKYKEMAEVIFTETYKPISFTDEDAVYAQFRALNNLADLTELINAFGTRSRNVLFVNIGNAMGLGAFLRTAMSDSEVGEINKILAQKNINYIF